MSDAQVLIVGAGPTGLVLALWLRRLGARVRVVDKAAEPGTTSRALGVQARTLEFYSPNSAPQRAACADRAAFKMPDTVVARQRRFGRHSGAEVIDATERPR